MEKLIREMTDIKKKEDEENCKQARAAANIKCDFYLKYSSTDNQYLSMFP